MYVEVLPYLVIGYLYISCMYIDATLRDMHTNVVVP